MADAQTVNANVAQCLRSVNDFGVTHVHNICNGTITNVPWGSADWMLAIGLIIGGIIFATFIAGFAIMVLKEMVWGY